ncbi:MAG: type II toxin-antitoxin system VapC family toxin [archaeon]|nr:type II toxin-antitoxin system VapC family toxin [archaeon]
MAIFLDTGFYFSLINKKDKYHHIAQELFKKMNTGIHGVIYTSDFILDEALTLINIRTYGKRNDLVEKMFNLFMGEEPIAKLIKVQEKWIYEIYSMQKRMTKPNNPLSFTDASNIILCNKLQIDKIISFDEHYRGILEIIEL